MFPRLARTSVAAVRRFSANASVVVLEPEKTLAREKTTASVKNPTASAARGRDTLGHRVFSLVHPQRSAVAVIRQWKEEGHVIRRYDLSHLVREMRKRRRYIVALEISEWMITQKDMKLVPGDYAVHLDLLAKIHGLKDAEQFFTDLPEEMRDSATYCAILQAYVHHKERDRAEALMKKMLECGLLNSPIPFNHMMSLYIAIGQFDKVPDIIQELKKTSSPDVRSYNLWLAYCASQNSMETAEEVFLELTNSKIEPDWVSYSTLTSIYMKNSLQNKAESALEDMEKKISKDTRLAYSSLISLHAAMGRKDDTLRIWEEMKSNYRKLTDAEYSCMISSLLKLNDLEMCEKLYGEWERVSPTKDSRISNLLLAGYINSDRMEKAENFSNRMMEKGIKPGYTTWELLTWGYLKQKNVYKAVDYFEKAVKSVRKWDSDEKLLREACSIVEEFGNIDCAEKLIVILQGAGCVNTEIYNSVLRTCAKAGKMPLDVEERMMKDNVEMDEETKRLLLQATRETRNCESSSGL